MFESGGFGDITDFVGLSSVAPNREPPTGANNSAKPVSDYVIFQAPVGPDVAGCEMGGTVTVTGDITNPLTVTPGDFLDYNWDDCDNGLEQVINGTIGLTFTDFEGSLLAGQLRLVVALNIQQFQVVTNGRTTRADGGLQLTIDSLDQPTTVIETLGTNLGVSTPGGRDTITEFSTTITEDGSMFPSHFTAEGTGTLTSTRFGGTITYITDVDFESIGDAYPYTGELLIFGSNGSNVRVIALSETDIRIEADYDGNGSTDATVATSWNALLGN